MKVSIITVVYNAADTLRKTIQSVLGQNYSEVEYIVIDGGSNDGTVEIIKDYQEEISYWISEPDGGVFDAMNKGINVATGDVIAFMNSGDWYEPEAFSVMASELEKTDADILYGRVNRIKNEKRIGYVGAFKEFDIEELYIRYIFCHQGMFIKRRIFDDIGLFDLRYKACSDYEWALRAVSRGKRIKLIPADIANFRLGGLSSRVEVAEEYLEITTHYSEGHADRLKRINKVYRMIYDYEVFSKTYRDLNGRDLAELLPEDAIYLIWGTGDYADDSYHLLNTIGREIVGFIDSYPREKVFYNRTVYNPADICDIVAKRGKVKIVIGSSVYENEIIEHLKQLKADAEYIAFRVILHWIGTRKKRLQNQSTGG